MFKIPDAPDFAGHRATFRDAVTKGQDGRPEYIAWRDDWTAYTAAVTEAKAAEQRHHDAQQRQFEHLWQEARRLEALSHRIGGRIDSADRGSFHYSQQMHDEAATKWREDLAEYTGQPVAPDQPVTVNAVPFVPHLSLAYYVVSDTGAPGTYSDELNAALNASVNI